MQDVQVLNARDFKFTVLDDALRGEDSLPPMPEAKRQGTWSFEIANVSTEMIALMTGNLELCRVCHGIVKMQVFKNTGVCCGNCQKADEKRQASCICSPMHRTKMLRYGQDHSKRCKAAA